MMPARSWPGRRVQAGMTLIELMVAMAIGLVVVLAAVAMLLVSRQGFTNVDHASRLRDNARFATDLVNRVALQAGYRDVRHAATERSGAAGAAMPPVFGFNNALPDPADPGRQSQAQTADGNGSDVLMLRYQVPETFPDSGVADASVIDCLGQSAAAGGASAGRDDWLTSIFHIGRQHGEPALMCTRIDAAGVAAAPRVVLAGVETFQVLYGADSVSPGAAPTGDTDSIAEQMLRADQLEVPGNTQATYANWRRVRSIRIGMVIRAPANSVLERAAQIFYPLGMHMWSAADPGSKLEPGADGRLRQVVTFTVHLRNEQGL